MGDDFDINTIIYEYDENGLNNYAFIERCIMSKLNIAQSFIQTNNLFDLLTYKIEKLDEYDNYLFIIEPITLYDCLKYTKYFSILLTIRVRYMRAIKKTRSSPWEWPSPVQERLQSFQLWSAAYYFFAFLRFS